MLRYYLFDFIFIFIAFTYTSNHNGRLGINCIQQGSQPNIEHEEFEYQSIIVFPKRHLFKIRIDFLNKLFTFYFLMVALYITAPPNITTAYIK